ncbi:MAG: GNAT family N-acetyltransferase [Alphaproteobacteria bacterium]|nr:GNAT family N-acetyltransferase [Alphaproteobacteria bacterium]
MFARTERLLLRPGWREDAPALAAAIGDESIVRNMASAPWPYSVADAEECIARADQSTLPNFLIFSRTRGAPRLVGSCGVTRDKRGALELGYWIARPFWGLGFATEAGKSVIHTARAMKLPKLQAKHALDNPASGNVLRKIGFRSTGRISLCHNQARGEDVPCALFEEGELVDMRPDPSVDIYQDGHALAA